MENFLRHYGYIALLLATFWGGEEGVVIAGFLSRAGYFDLFWTVIISAIGGALGDQFYFNLARSRGLGLVQKSKRLSRTYPKAADLINRYGTWIVLFSRFLAGLRITIPVVCAIGKMSRVRYTLLNLLSAFLWATIFSVAAYHSGPIILQWIKSVRFGWYLAITGLVLLGMLWYLWRRRRKAKGKGRGAKDEEGRAKGNE